jgi:hypothetical protein
MSVDAARDSYRQGDYLGATLNTGAATLDLSSALGKLAAAGILVPMAKGFDKAIYKASRQPFSRLKGISTSDMEAEFEHGLLPIPRHVFNLDKVPVGSWIVPSVWDPSAAGKWLTGVNGMRFHVPVKLDAGSDMVRGPQMRDDNVFSASALAQSQAQASHIRRLQATGYPVYTTHLTLGPESLDFTSKMVRTLLQMIKPEKLTKDAKTSFDIAMRSPWRGHTPDPDFPGLDKITDEWIDEPGSGWRRTKFVKLMDTGRFRDMGFPDVASARWAITLPELRNVPIGTTGHHFTLVGPEPVAPVLNPTHPMSDFDTQLRSGTYAGRSPSPIPMDLFWDVLRSLPADQSVYKKLNPFVRHQVAQRVTAEMQDRVMRYWESEEGKRLGWAGAIAAGLITADQARDLFGYNANGKS